MSLLALFNPSKAFLAMSTVLAGYCLFRFYASTAGNFLVFPYLMAAGALLGMADSAWKSIFAAADAHAKHPDEPASGTISTAASFFAAVFTSLAGLMCAMTAGYNSFRVGAAVLLLSLARATLFRRTEVVTPLLKGLTFGALYVLGATAHASYFDIFLTDELRIPAAFFVLYIVVAAVLSQVRDSAHPRAAPPDEELSSVTASRLLEARDDAIDGFVAWFAGAALFLIPLVLAFVIPWKWLSITILAFLSLTTATRLIPVLVYKTRKDLSDFLEAVYRGSALLNAGAVASHLFYIDTEIHDGWVLPMPSPEQLAAIVAIIFLAFPAWLLRRAAPVD